MNRRDLQAPDPTNETNGGELGDVVAAGDRPFAGVFGAAHLHPTGGDRMRGVQPRLVETAVGGFPTFVTDALRSSARR